MTRTTTRRTFVRALGGAAVGAAAFSGSAAAAGGTDLSEWLSDTSNADGVVDKRGQSEVAIDVGVKANGGKYGFGPAAVRVDPGTKVVWKWVHGSHNVVDRDGAFESSYLTSSGDTFEYTPKEAGVVEYYCAPHKPMGMKGALVVGDAEVSMGGGTPAAGTTTEGGAGEAAGRFDGWLANTPNFDGVVDKRGQDEVVVEVAPDGKHVFSPAAVHVDPGTKVVWTWPTDGDAHDVVDSEGRYASDPASGAGSRYAVRFDGDGLSKYECENHGADGMRGVVLVGGGPGTMTTTAAAGLGVTALAGAAVLGKGVLLHMENTTGPSD